MTDQMSPLWARIAVVVVLVGVAAGAVAMFVSGARYQGIAFGAVLVAGYVAICMLCGIGAVLAWCTWLDVGVPVLHWIKTGRWLP